MSGRSGEADRIGQTDPSETFPATLADGRADLGTVIHAEALGEPAIDGFELAPHCTIATSMEIRLHAFTGIVVALTLTSPPTDRDCRAASERRGAAIFEVINALRA